MQKTSVLLTSSSTQLHLYGSAEEHGRAWMNPPSPQKRTLSFTNWTRLPRVCILPLLSPSNAAPRLPPAIAHLVHHVVASRRLVFIVFMGVFAGAMLTAASKFQKR